MENFGEFIRKWLDANSISHRAFEEKYKISRGTLRRILKMTRYDGTKMVFSRLAAALGMMPEQLQKATEGNGSPLSSPLLPSQKDRTFRIDGQLDDSLDKYCNECGMVADRVIEAMIYMAAVERHPDPTEIFAAIRRTGGVAQPLAAVNKGTSIRPRKTG